MSAAISRHMRGATKEQMIRRRDAAGGEMEALARIANEPKPSADEVIAYIKNLVKKGHISAQEAAHLLETVPHDPGALRNWARRAFAMVMHQGIHAHAAYPRQLYPSLPQDQAQPAQADQAPSANGTPTIQ